MHDAEQSLSLMNEALPYLEGIEIRINIYFGKKKSIRLLISVEIC